MSDPLDTLSKIGKITARSVGKAIEKVITQFIAPFSKEHLETMIKRDITILELLAAKIKKYDKLSPRHQKMLKIVLAVFGFVKSLVSKLPRETIEPYLTYKKAIKWIKKQKPELYELLTSEEGKKWLTREINELKEWLYDGGKKYGYIDGKNN